MVNSVYLSISKEKKNCITYYWYQLNCLKCSDLLHIDGGFTSGHVVVGQNISLNCSYLLNNHYSLEWKVPEALENKVGFSTITICYE